VCDDETREVSEVSETSLRGVSDNDETRDVREDVGDSDVMEEA
jgi:hypothetical protein